MPIPRMFSTDLGRTSLPARGLFYSVLIHCAFAAIVRYVPWDYWMPGEVHLVSAEHMQQHEVLLLPELEPMASSPAPSSSGDAGESTHKFADATSPKATEGIVYQGPQVIISAPPHPDNFIQTIQQPDLARKLKLPAPLPVPSLVAIAPSKPVLAPQPSRPAPEAEHQVAPTENHPVEAAMAQPIMVAAEQARVEAPKLPFPGANSTDTLHALSNTAPAQMPKLVRRVPPTKPGADTHNVLVVNALPVNVPAAAAVPPGELSGAFTVSPMPVASRPGAGKLAGGGVEINGVPGVGNGSGAGNGTSTSVNGGVGANAGMGIPGGDGKGTRAGTGSGGGPDHGNGPAKLGNGSGNGGLQIAINRGGGGSGNGSSPFQGITIQGGSSPSRSVVRSASPSDPKPSGAYGITIVANGATGGGFKDFGVFQDEASYTVYLDMRGTGAMTSSWTLQYALYTHRLPGSAHMAHVPHGLLTPPYALTKNVPCFSAELAKRAAGTTIVVFGIVNLDGKLEDLQVMQSPDPSLNKPLLDSLAKWTFQPAQMDGAHVPVKFLLGVPVNSVPRA